MIMAPQKKLTRDLYLMNWLKIRVDWLLIVMDNNHRKLTTASSWREYLAFCANPRKEKHATVLRTMKQVWNVYSKDIACRGSMWAGRELRAEDLDLHTCREITWELCQVGFRYELWALDSIIVRREGPHALDIAAERNRWINEVCGDNWLTRAEEHLTYQPKLGANTIEERSRPLEALCRLMRAWPNKPEELADIEQPLDDAGLERVERAVAQFYVLTFVRHAGRPPTVPRNTP